MDRSSRAKPFSTIITKGIRNFDRLFGWSFLWRFGWTFLAIGGSRLLRGGVQRAVAVPSEHLRRDLTEINGNVAGSWLFALSGVVALRGVFGGVGQLEFLPFAVFGVTAFVLVIRFLGTVPLGHKWFRLYVLKCDMIIDPILQALGHP